MLYSSGGPNRPHNLLGRLMLNMNVTGAPDDITHLSLRPKKINDGFPLIGPKFGGSVVLFFSGVEPILSM